MKQYRYMRMPVLKVFRNQKNIQYTTTDLFSPLADFTFLLNFLKTFSGFNSSQMANTFLVSSFRFSLMLLCVVLISVPWRC